MTLDKTKLNNARGYWEGPSEAVDPETAALVDSYKKTVCKNYISLNPGQIDDRLGGMSFYVTRKYDGEFSMLLWNGTDLFTVNTGGKVRTGLPCMEEAAKLLKAAGIREAAIPSELHVDEARGRRRVFDVLAALADPSLHDSLRLAPFDIVSLNGEPFRAASYGAAHEKLEALFPGGGYCGPVRCQGADSKALVKDLFVKWVEEEGAEGLVVRSELPLIYKIKPRYSIDAAVVGFSESAENRGQIRSLLLALMPEEGIFQIIGRSGTGLGEELKRELFERLMGMKIPSKYTETDSNHVAFHMIRPEIVIELTVNDVLFETGSGAIFNPKLEIKNNEYRRVGAVPGISVVFPIFERIREDKTVSLRDVRLAQADEIVFNPYAEPAAAARELPESTVLCRDVYKKTQGTKLMVQKFLAWKTNKEHAGYPAYVVSYTNFSSERADPLQCEVRVSGSREQILELYQNFMEKNIKKGWAKVE